MAHVCRLLNIGVIIKYLYSLGCSAEISGKKGLNSGARGTKERPLARKNKCNSYSVAEQANEKYEKRMKPVNEIDGLTENQLDEQQKKKNLEVIKEYTRQANEVEHKIEEMSLSKEEQINALLNKIEQQEVEMQLLKAMAMV